MFRRVTVVCITILLFAFGQVTGRDYNFSFDHIGMEDGLPARMVYDIVQDQEGFIWISSQLGIHRFDGQDFKTYSSLSMDLPSRIPPRLAIDGENRLWISCAVPLKARSRTVILDLKEDRLYTVGEATEGQLTEDEVLTIASKLPSEKGILILRPDGTLFGFDGKLEYCGRFSANRGGRIQHPWYSPGWRPNLGNLQREIFLSRHAIRKPDHGR